MLKLLRIHWTQSANMFRPFPPFRHQQLARILVFFSAVILFSALGQWIHNADAPFFDEQGYGNAPRMAVMALIFFVGLFLYAVNTAQVQFRFSHVSYQGMRFSTFYIPSLLARLFSIPVLITAAISFWVMTAGFDEDIVIFPVIGSVVLLASFIVIVTDIGQSLGMFLRFRFEQTFWFNFVVSTLLTICGIIALVFFIRSSLAEVWQFFVEMAIILAWIPPFSVWFLPAIFEQEGTGIFGFALVTNLVALIALTVASFLLAKRVSLMRLTQGVREEVGKLGLFRLFPGTDVGAIAARSTIYRLRDPRYRLDLFALIILPVFVTVTLSFVGVPENILSLIPVPIFALMLGWSLHNDIAFDGSAFWQHLATGITERADRVGRTIPLLLWGGVVVIAGSVFSAVLVKDVSLIPTIIGFSAAAFGTASGIGSITAVMSIYPAPAPHQSAFKQPLLVQGQASGGPLSLILSLLLTAIPVGLYILFYSLPNALTSTIVMTSGLAIGAIVYYIGIRYGSYQLRKRGPELVAIIRSAQ